MYKNVLGAKSEILEYITRVNFPVDFVCQQDDNGKFVANVYDGDAAVCC